MPLFLGVDGGQSSTVALISDETGKVLGVGRGGPCNHVAAAEGRAKFARVMEACLGEACTQAGLDSRTASFQAACLGFSGGAADKESYSRELIRSNAFKITHDAEIALTGATGGEPGIIVIAGTGSIAFGKNAARQTSRVGGWGYIFGDEGGAFDIVRQALRAALAMEEGWGAPTVLRERLLEETASDYINHSANQLMHNWYNSFDRRLVAQLAPVVDAAAQAGDDVAQRILERAGRQLSALIANVYRTLFEPRRGITISHVGGVFKSGPLIAVVRQEVQVSLECQLTPPLLPPAGGALLESLQMCGLRVRLSGLPHLKS